MYKPDVIETMTALKSECDKFLRSFELMIAFMNVTTGPSPVIDCLNARGPFEMSLEDAYDRSVEWVTEIKAEADRRIVAEQETWRKED